MRIPRPTTVARVALLAGAYFALAKIGLGVATVGHSVTLVWPPTGLALAALLLGSRRLWPGVAIGAFVVNATTPGVGLLTAAAIAAGNTLEAVVGATLVRRRPFRQELDGVRDVLRFVVFGAAAGTAVSASVGTLSLLAAGLIPSTAVLATWRVWWVGDAIGALVVAPVLLAWATRPRDEERHTPGEVFALAVTLVGASLGTLTQPHGTRPYLVFPPLIWAALRFGPRGATAATLAISIVTLASTIVGQGAFVVSSLGDNLMALDAFVASVALTSLVLGATAAERSRALRAREHFISIASHELRTPLAPLRLQVQRLLRGLRRGTNVPTPEALIDGLVIVDRQVERLTALLENVLDLTRLRLGRLPLAAEPFDLAALIDEIATAQRDSLAQHGGSLRIDRHGPTTGTWDRARLAQVVMNLLTNAVKHGGGVVELSLAGATGTVTIVVRDHGPGIPVGAEERIFHRFEHAGAPDDDPRTSGSGLGLGLYIAREIVEAHRGRLTVERPADGGAAFKIELPAGPDVMPPAAPRS